MNYVSSFLDPFMYLGVWSTLWRWGHMWNFRRIWEYQAALACYLYLAQVCCCYNVT
jgi:hypothetical protein